MKEVLDMLDTKGWRSNFITLIGLIGAVFFATFLFGYLTGSFAAAHSSVANSPIVNATASIVQGGNWQSVVIIFLNNLLLITIALAGAYFIGWWGIPYLPCIFQPAIAGYVSGSYAKLGVGLQGLQIVGTIGVVEFLVMAFAGSIGLYLVQVQDKKVALQTLAVCAVVLLIAAIAEVAVFI